VYQLCVLTVDGTERVGTFDDERDLLSQQRLLESSLVGRRVHQSAWLEPLTAPARHPVLAFDCLHFCETVIHE
jgi:hypothetical protein